jgi:hypothetical protein
MFPIQLFSSLRVLPSRQFATANAHRSHTALVAGLALCAAILAMPPVYGEGGESSSRASADSTTNHQTMQLGTVVPDTQENLKSTLTVEPKVKTLMGSGVVYTNKCHEISTGRWEIDKLPAYGKISMGTITGTLKKSPCPGVKFTSGAIFYTWTKPTKAKEDGFQATYFGYVNPVHVTWTLKLK